MDFLKRSRRIKVERAILMSLQVVFAVLVTITYTFNSLYGQFQSQYPEIFLALLIINRIVMVSADFFIYIRFFSLFVFFIAKKREALIMKTLGPLNNFLMDPN